MNWSFIDWIFLPHEHMLTHTHTHTLTSCWLTADPHTHNIPYVSMISQSVLHGLIRLSRWPLDRDAGRGFCVSNWTNKNGHIPDTGAIDETRTALTTNSSCSFVVRPTAANRPFTASVSLCPRGVGPVCTAPNTQHHPAPSHYGRHSVRCPSPPRDVGVHQLRKCQITFCKE